MTKDDIDLLQNAAVAAGIRIRKFVSETGNCYGYAQIEVNEYTYGENWNPLADDGDALRLACALGISVLMFPACIGTKWPQQNLPDRLFGAEPPYEDISSGRCKSQAVRRAIVRAAAMIST